MTPRRAGPATRAEPDSGWSAWQRVPGLPPFSADVLAETLDEDVGEDRDRRLSFDNALNEPEFFLENVLFDRKFHIAF